MRDLGQRTGVSDQTDSVESGVSSHMTRIVQDLRGNQWVLEEIERGGFGSPSANQARIKATCGERTIVFEASDDWFDDDDGMLMFAIEKALHEGGLPN